MIAHKRRAVVAALTTTVSLTALAALAPASANERVVVAEGHVDIVSVHLENDELVMRLNDDSGASPVLRDPGDVTLRVRPEAEEEVPDDPQYAFLGEPGDIIWRLPDQPVSGLLFPGWSTETIEFGMLQDDQITLSLLDVTGPGEVALYFVGPFGGPDVRFNSTDGLPDSDAVEVRLHAHTNWTFTEAGSYTMTWQAEGALPDGTPVSTGPIDYHWVVGEMPDDPSGDATQDIVATIDPARGELVISVNPDDRTVELPPATLSPEGDRWQTSGELRPVTVTDTRTSAPGWSASAQSSSFVSGTDTFDAAHLGWTPSLLEQSPGQDVEAGSQVTSALDGGPGLTGSATLATAPAGSGRGTAILSAELALDLPTDTPLGTYRATLTFTAI